MVLYCVTASAIFAWFIFAVLFFLADNKGSSSLADILPILPALMSSAAIFVCAYWVSGNQEQIQWKRKVAPLVIFFMNVCALFYFFDSSFYVLGIGVHIPMAVGYLIIMISSA